MTDQTEYSFLDWTREFGGTDADIRVVTKDKMIFEKYMETYTDANLECRFPENERKYGDSDFGKTDGMM